MRTVLLALDVKPMNIEIETKVSETDIKLIREIS